MKNRIGPGTSGKTQDVAVQDQTTPPIFLKFSKVLNTTTLAADTDRVLAPYTIELSTVPAEAIVGTYTGIFSLESNRYYVGTIVGILGTTITLDTQLDSDFVTGNLVGFGRTNLNVNGSVVPEIFSIRGADPGLDITLDITRVIFTCVTTNPVNLTDFGDILNGLPRGLAFRRTDGVTQNFVNFKTNIEMKGWMLDWESLDDTNPGQGLHGFAARLTFSGQEKLGVVVRISFGDELQILVQDNLSTLLSFEVTAEGHVVDF